MPQYKYGRRKELEVGEFLERRDYSWERSQGSKGPIDLIAKKGRRKWGIQVKATRKGYIEYTRLTIDEENKLIEEANYLGVEPILALITRNYVWFITVPDQQLLLEGTLRHLKYIYNEK